MSDVLSKERVETERANADLSLRAGAWHDAVIALCDSHEALRAELASHGPCETCAKLSCSSDQTGERYSMCAVLGQLPDELPDGFGCNQWAARDTARPEGGEQ